MIEIKFFREFGDPEPMCIAQLDTDDPSAPVENIHWSGDTDWIEAYNKELEYENVNHLMGAVTTQRETAQRLRWKLISVIRYLFIANAPDFAMSEYDIPEPPPDKKQDEIGENGEYILY